MSRYRPRLLVTFHEPNQNPDHSTPAPQVAMAPAGPPPSPELTLEAFKIALRSGKMPRETRKALRLTCKELKESHALLHLKFRMASDLQWFLQHGWTSSVESLNCHFDQPSGVEDDVDVIQRLMGSNLPKLLSIRLESDSGPLPWHLAAVNWPQIKSLGVSSWNMQTFEGFWQQSWPNVEELSFFCKGRPSHQSEVKTSVASSLPKLRSIHIITIIGMGQTTLLVQQFQSCRLPALVELKVGEDDESPPLAMSSLLNASWLPQLRSLDVPISSKEICPLLQVLETTTALTTISITITSTAGTNEHTTTTAPSFPSLPHLESLKISDACSCGGISRAQLVSAIGSLTVQDFPSLTKLDVSDVPMTAEAACSVGKLAIQLRELGLICNCLNDKSVEALVEGMKAVAGAHSITLERVEMSDNHRIGRVGVRCLIPFCINHCNELMELGLEDIRFTENPDAEAFALVKRCKDLPFVVHWSMF